MSVEGQSRRIASLGTFMAVRYGSETDRNSATQQTVDKCQ